LGPIEAAVEEWKKLSPSFKAFSVISAFINLGAITSVSEQIIKWRGFIREVVEVWRSVSKPVTDFLHQLIGLPIAQFQLDFFVVLMVYMGAVARVEWQYREIAQKRWASYPINLRGRVEKWGDIGITVAFYFSPVAVLFSPKMVWVMGGMLILVLSFLWVIFLPSVSGASVEDQRTKKQIALLYMYLFLVVSLFLVLFAIHQGFSKSLPVE
jgi:integral membrane sensor domain MASE1